MARARKCDRCGCCYDPYHMDRDFCRFRNPIFENADSMKEVKIAYKLYEDSEPDAWVDLCPDCSAQFVTFMNGSKIGVEDAFREFCDSVRELLDDIHNQEDKNG